ncbi:hypothetical protein CN380_23840 [Bacillus sp. AFS017274]|nr:hypothetical protein CN380_23840 [Bacillus sp. AFS017274]
MEEKIFRSKKNVIEKVASSFFRYWLLFFKIVLPIGYNTEKSYVIFINQIRMLALNPTNPYYSLSNVDQVLQMFNKIYFIVFMGGCILLK